MSLPFGGDLLPTRREAIQSYDFQDIANGIGISRFYLAITGESSPSYHLVEDTIISTKNTTGDATLNFDTGEFNLPRTLKGIASVSLATVAAVASGSGADTGILISGIKLTHIHSAGTTDLTNSFTTSETTETSSGPANDQRTRLIVFNSISPTVIKKGDQIRLTLTTDSTKPATGNLMCNPAGTSQVIAGQVITQTKSQLNLPFVVDVT